MDPLTNLKRKVNFYQEVLKNTEQYRTVWSTELRQNIETELRKLTKDAGLTCKIETKGQENLQAVILSLGSVNSGLSEEVAEEMFRPLIKNNGALIYQQLFNGKVMVAIQMPFIEKYGQPQPPSQIAIYRPEEIQAPFFVRHLETFIDQITRWEDFDDDRIDPDPNNAIGFKLNFDKPE